jgi:ParB-like chromosome segregation protein Spo0J
METKIVKAEDVYPSGMNPRSDFGDLEGLNASFEFNTERPGEPFNPPVVVADGGIYRLIDGERRYRAMTKVGKRKEFTALVCDSMEEADVVAAALATDDKKGLTEIERSRGVQQMLLLGVDPIKVDKASRRRGSMHVKRAMSVLGDDINELTFDQLLAVDEFRDNEDAINEILDATPSKANTVIEQLRKQREREENNNAALQALYDTGRTVYESRDDLPEGYTFDRMLWGRSQIDTYLASKDLREDEVYVVSKATTINAAVYSPAEDTTAVDAERERIRQAAAELASVIERMKSALFRRYIERVRDNMDMDDNMPKRSTQIAQEREIKDLIWSLVVSEDGESTLAAINGRYVNQTTLAIANEVLAVNSVRHNVFIQRDWMYGVCLYGLPAINAYGEQCIYNGYLNINSIVSGDYSYASDREVENAKRFLEVLDAAKVDGLYSADVMADYLEYTNAERALREWLIGYEELKGEGADNDGE